MARSLISVSESTVARLIAMKAFDDESFDLVINRLLDAARPPVIQPDPVVPMPTPAPIIRRPGRHLVEVQGHQVGCWTLQETLAEGIRMLADRDETFLPRLAEVRTRSRRAVARQKADLYPDSPHLAAKFSRDIGGGWYLATNCSRVDVKRWLKYASQIAGLRYGKDLIVRFG